jgi:PQQ-dependent catabolism-associated CXXCW motif protein
MSIRFHLILAAALAVAPLAASAQPRPGYGAGPAPANANPEQMTQAERQDLGVAPVRTLHAGPMHGPTPASIPGGQVVTTPGLAALLQGRQLPFVLIDVLGHPETLPGAFTAAWLAQPGSFKDAVQQQAVQLFGQLTQGRKDVAMIFYCLSRECWMSYNAALRAVQAGYSNVLWYRGGIEAWRMAGFPTQAATQAATQAGPGSGGQAPGGYGGQPPAGYGGQAGAGARPGGAPQPPRAGVPGRFVPVEALPGPAGSARPTESLRIERTNFFTFAQPPGWKLAEQGQFALTQFSADMAAFTMLVGNAGMPLNTPAGAFVYRKLSVLQPQQLQVGQPRPAAPLPGVPQTMAFDVNFVWRGARYLGLAKVFAVPAHDSATMGMTMAAALAEQWPGYGTWLPQVADLVSANNGAAFGMRGVMSQNLRNSQEFARVARDYQDWSQKNWAGVTADRERSVASRNGQFRETLGGVGSYANPFGSSPPKELPSTHKYYWMDRQERMVGTDDPTANPNVGSTGEWRRMDRVVQ